MGQWGISRLVIGLGCQACGDDGVGPATAHAVRELRLPDVHVAVVEDPADLVPLWGAAELVVVVDAVAAGGPAGSLDVVDLTDRASDGGACDGGARGVAQRAVGERAAGVSRAGERCAADAAWMRGGVGPYAFGLAAAVQLGRALHRLPGRLLLVGVEGSSFAPGAPLSPAVADAVGPASRVVADLVSLEPVGAGAVGVGRRPRDGGIDRW